LLVIPEGDLLLSLPLPVLAVILSEAKDPGSPSQPIPLETFHPIHSGRPRKKDMSEQNTKMGPGRFRAPLVLLVLNVIGAILYVVRASQAWAIPQEQRVVPITGEPFVWFLSILPVVAVFALIDFTWGALILSRRHWRSGSSWLLAALIWSIAIAVDFAHH
jgi:hypothetical protein